MVIIHPSAENPLYNILLSLKTHQDDFPHPAKGGKIEDDTPDAN